MIIGGGISGGGGGELLWCCGPVPRDDEEVVRAAVWRGAWALGAASPRLRSKLARERPILERAAAVYGQVSECGGELGG